MACELFELAEDISEDTGKLLVAGKWIYFWTIAAVDLLPIHLPELEEGIVLFEVIPENVEIELGVDGIPRGREAYIPPVIGKAAGVYSALSLPWCRNAACQPDHIPGVRRHDKNPEQSPFSIGHS